MKSMLEVMGEIHAEMRASVFMRTCCGDVKDASQGTGIVIKRRLVPEWTGLIEAARVLGRSPTQVLRHISGKSPSKKLQADMERHGIRVEVAV